MKKIYILFAFCLTLNICFGNDLLDKTMIHMRESFQKLVDFNEANDLRGESHKNNYIFYYQPLVDYTPLPPVTNWLLQIPDETFPNAEKWSADLTHYNTLGEYEHYVIVLYINNVLQSKVYNALDNEDSTSPTWFKLYYDNLENIPDTNDENFYKNQVLELRNYFKQHFKLSSVFTESKNKYISFCTIINYFDNILGDEQIDKKLLVKIKGYHASNISPSFLEGIADFYAVRDLRYPGEGIARIGQLIRAFVDKFYSEEIEALPCPDLSNKATYQVTGQYINIQCPKVINEFDKEFVIQSAAYLDYLYYMYLAFGEDDTALAFADYQAYANTLAEYYFQNANGTDPKLVMRSYWDDEANSSDHEDYLKRLYFKYFYNINQNNIVDIENRFYCAIPVLDSWKNNLLLAAGFQPTIGVGLALSIIDGIYEDIHSGFVELANGNYSFEELNNILENLKAIPDIERILWSEYLHGVGFPHSGIEGEHLTIALSNFIVKGTIVNANSTNSVFTVDPNALNHKYIVDKFSESFVPGTNGENIVSDYDYSDSEDKKLYTISGSYCKDFDVQQLAVGLNTTTTFQCTDSDPFNISLVNFWDIVHKVTLTNPECLETYGFDGTLPIEGYQKSYPVAGFAIPSAVKHENFENFEKGLIISLNVVATIASAGALNAAYIPYMRFLHGIFLINNVTSFFTLTDPEAFTNNMKSTFGNDLGQDVATTVISINIALGLIEGGVQMSSAFKSVDQKKAAAVSYLLDDAVKHSNLGSVPGLTNPSYFRTFGKWLEPSVAVRSQTALDDIDDIIRLYYKLDEVTWAQRTENLKRMILRCYQGNIFPNIGDHLINVVGEAKLLKLIDDMDAVVDFKLANWISGATEEAEIIQRIKIWSLADDVSSSFARDVEALKKLLNLKTNGELTNLQIKNICLLDDIPALTLSENLVWKSISLNLPIISNLDELAEKAILLRGYKSDAITILDDMVKHPGYKNPEDLFEFIKTNSINTTNGTKKGWKYELDVFVDDYLPFASKEFNFSKQAFTTTGTKEVDFISLVEVREVKTWASLDMSIEGPESNLILKQLFTKLGKQIGNLDYTHPTQVDIVNKIGRGKIITETHPSYFMDEGELKLLLRETYIDPNPTVPGAHLDNMSELIIENSTGKYKFYPSDWQN